MSAIISEYLVGAVVAVAIASQAMAATVQTRVLASIRGQALSVDLHSDGSYSIGERRGSGTVLKSDVEAEVGQRSLSSSQYPRHTVIRSAFKNDFGTGTQMRVTHSGLSGTPDLVWTVRLYRDQAFGEMDLEVVNSTGRPIDVGPLRTVHTLGAPVIALGGPESSDRILSDSFSEDRPMLTIRELSNPKLAGIHRAVGSQLIYNRTSGTSLFLGAMTSDRLLTIFHLNVRGEGAETQIASYDVVATGTTELQRSIALRESPASQQVELHLPVDPGQSLSAERLMFAVGNDYHAQLETYGRVTGRLHNARVSAPTPMGFWSWTAYYFGLNEGSAVTNAQWLANNLKDLGYDYFHIDEGYQYARGEYTTPDVTLFPHGMRYVADQAHIQGLRFGIWTSPFEVSNRSSVFRDHEDWLLHNAAGDLIQIGHLLDSSDALYVLDTTHPGAQEYLEQTYRILAQDWGVQYIKMDFMDDTAIEGSYHRSNTTALEAERIGLQIIRRAVGDDVLLDKDGSPMLNPVGIVDTGRISLDTGHSFEGVRDAATGIAARYYMNRSWFVSDPDAFSVSTQTVKDQSWHEGKEPLTLDEAKVSISLAAVSGGMFEIGDDLTALGSLPERLALVRNPVLIDMARLGRASRPVDLMTYASTDQRPSVFLLKESPRQAVLTVFNWTENEMKRSLSTAVLGLNPPARYRVTEVFGNDSCYTVASTAITLVQSAHSVCMLRWVDETAPISTPLVQLNGPSQGKSGELIAFDAEPMSEQDPVLGWHWDFGDGTSEDGKRVRHAFTRAGEYEVRVTATGLDATKFSKSLKLNISGDIPTTFVPAKKRRPDD